MKNQEHQRQVESWLGRALKPSELTPAASLEALSPAQLAVVEAVALRDAFSAMLYLRLIIENALVKDLKPFVDGIISAARGSRRADLPNLPLFEHCLGRPLEPGEKTQVAALTALSPAHIAVATALLRLEPQVGFMYLQRIVPTAARDELLKIEAALRSGSDA